jgi:oxaloacetate decarboxylase beta subunit
MLDLFYQFLSNTGYFLADYRHVIMIIVGCIFLYLGTAKKYEPLLLVPIGLVSWSATSLSSKALALGSMNPTVYCTIFISALQPVSIRRLSF